MNTDSPNSSRVNFPDPGYPTCEDTYAMLVIYPGSHSPEDVTDVLRIQPTNTQREGEQVTNSRQRTRTAKNSLWILSSEKLVTSKDLRDHLNWLVDRLQDRQIGLKKLQGWDDLKMTISCIWWSAVGHGGPVLWPEQMQALADLNLECSFDIYFFNDDE